MVEEKLYAEHADVEANPLGELFLPGMSDVQKKRAKQLAFMLMMHTKIRAIQMVTRLSVPVSGLEIWRRFLEEWEPVNRGRYRAMLMQLLQCPLMGSRGQALKEWERRVRQYEVQNLDTIKAAILEHNPHDSEWYRCVRLTATRQQVYDALKSVWKEKGRSKNKSKEGTSDTSKTKCSSCKGKDCPKSLTWPAEKKTMSHELCKLTMIGSDANETIADSVGTRNATARNETGELRH